MGTGTARCGPRTPGYDLPVRTYAAQVVPGEAVGGRVVRTSLVRGPSSAVVVCGGCARWLAVGHRPDDVADVLLVCAACDAVNDLSGATPVPDDRAAPDGLPPTEMWAKSAVERVHALAAQEQRWPWRAG